MKTRTLVFFSFIVMSLAAASPARAGLLEFFFPMLKKQEADPAHTLQAPFAAQTPATGEGAAKAPMGPPAIKPLPENAIPLGNPHRSTGQITDWVVTAVSESMTFDKNDSAENFAATGGYFSTIGRAQYEKFLKDSRLSNVIESNKYYVRSYVREVPVLLNEGAVNEHYRWLYEVPVMVSYMERGANYTRASPVNQEMTVTIQIGRSPRAANAAGIMIETWSGTVRKLDKK